MEVDIIKKTENQAKMTKLSMEWKILCKIKAKVAKITKVRVNTEESQQFGAGTEKNTMELQSYPSDGPGEKPNSSILRL
ncbi:hypothetical protein Tco_0467967 [Tanacetum coccineum]